MLAGKSRKTLSGEVDGFQPFFAAEKATVAGMTLRWVVVPEAVTQALLEVYAALELERPLIRLRRAERPKLHFAVITPFAS